MPKRATMKPSAKRKGGKQGKPARKAVAARIVVRNPLNSDIDWELELLGISKNDFLALWTSGSDRIGFNLTERTVYDKTQVIARIAKEVKERGPKSTIDEE